jgi:hypothetical protein
MAQKSEAGHWLYSVITLHPTVLPSLSNSVSIAVTLTFRRTASRELLPFHHALRRSSGLGSMPQSLPS